MITGPIEERRVKKLNLPWEFRCFGRTRTGVLRVYNFGGARNINRDESLIEPVMLDSDMDLVVRAQKGDIGAYGELVGRYQRSVYGIVSRMVNNRDDVDDIAQDVFVLAYKYIGTFKRQSSFSTWLHSIAVNTTLKQLKKMKVRQSYSIDDPDLGVGDKLESDSRPDEDAVRAERAREIKKAISLLPEKHRAVVVLYYYEQYSCEEIAKITGCSIGTVWSRLHYACKKLKGQLQWIGG